MVRVSSWKHRCGDQLRDGKACPVECSNVGTGCSDPPPQQCHSKLGSSTWQRDGSSWLGTANAVNGAAESRPLDPPQPADVLFGESGPSLPDQTKPNQGSPQPAGVLFWQFLRASLSNSPLTFAWGAYSSEASHRPIYILVSTMNNIYILVSTMRSIYILVSTMNNSEKRGEQSHCHISSKARREEQDWWMRKWRMN